MMIAVASNLSLQQLIIKFNVHGPSAASGPSEVIMVTSSNPSNKKN